MPKVLIIEDAQDVRENLVDLLEINDYLVLSAEDGLRGLYIAHKELPDIIISDIMMPGLNGHEVLQEIRHHPDTSDIPVIFLTAKASSSDFRIGMNLGADDYIAKPFNASDVLEAVATRLRRKEQVVRKMEYISDSISNYIPHELRTPLTAISGFTNFILQEIETIDRSEIAEMLQKVLHASDRLHSVIEKFIEFSKSELLRTQKQEGTTVEDQSEMNPILLSYLFHLKIEQLGKSPELQLDVQTQSIKVSEEHLLRILSEIVENAVKFSDCSTPIRITSLIHDEKYLLSVSGSGTGMTKKEIQSVAAFNQHNRKIFEQSGNGLGLAIVKNLCEYNNCTMTITSDAESFTEVRIEFPIASTGKQPT